MSWNVIQPITFCVETLGIGLCRLCLYVLKHSGGIGLCIFMHMWMFSKAQKARDDNKRKPANGIASGSIPRYFARMSWTFVFYH